MSKNCCVDLPNFSLQDRSFDCKVTGERDGAVRAVAHKAKKPNRKKLSPGDMILGVGASAG